MPSFVAVGGWVMGKSGESNSSRDVGGRGWRGYSYRTEGAGTLRNSPTVRGTIGR